MKVSRARLIAPKVTRLKNKNIEKFLARKREIKSGQEVSSSLSFAEENCWRELCGTLLVDCRSTFLSNVCSGRRPALSCALTCLAKSKP